MVRKRPLRFRGAKICYPKPGLPPTSKHDVMVSLLEILCKCFLWELYTVLGGSWGNHRDAPLGVHFEEASVGASNTNKVRRWRGGRAIVNHPFATSLMRDSDSLVENCCLQVSRVQYMVKQKNRYIRQAAIAGNWGPYDLTVVEKRSIFRRYCQVRAKSRVSYVKAGGT